MDLLNAADTVIASMGYRALARDVTTTPLRHFGAQPDFAVYGRDGELCCC